MTLDPTTATLIGVIITGIVTAGGYIVKARSDARQSLPDQYEALLDQTRKTFESQLDTLREQVNMLTAKVSELEKSREVDRGKYKACLRHIRNWRARYPDDLEEMPPPPEIEEDL